MYDDQKELIERLKSELGGAREELRDTKLTLHALGGRFEEVQKENAKLLDENNKYLGVIDEAHTVLARSLQ